GRGYDFTGVELLSMPANPFDTNFLLNGGVFEFITDFTASSSSDISRVADTRDGHSVSATQIYEGIDVSLTYPWVIFVLYVNISTYYFTRWLKNHEGISTIRIEADSGWINTSDFRCYQDGILLSIYEDGEGGAYVKPTSTTLTKMFVGGAGTGAAACDFALFNFETSKFIINCDESAGLISYDASGNGNHGTISLGGSAESSFHIESSEVESVQNEVGYNPGVPFFNTSDVIIFPISDGEYTVYAKFLLRSPIYGRYLFSQSTVPRVYVKNSTSFEYVSANEVFLDSEEIIVTFTGHSKDLYIGGKYNGSLNFESILSEFILFPILTTTIVNSSPSTSPC
ncbi:unnamed protein product, partial [marine sediment metagenome]